MTDAKRKEFLQFLAEPYLFEPEFTDVWNKCNAQHKKLDWMCWIKWLKAKIKMFGSVEHTTR